MPVLRTHLARPLLAGALAVNFLLFANVSSSLHTCHPLAYGIDGRHRPGVSLLHHHASARPETAANPTRGPRDRSVPSDTLERDRACLACLFGAQLRNLSLPASTDTAALAEARQIPHLPERVQAASRVWDRILPRAPPSNTTS